MSRQNREIAQGDQSGRPFPPEPGTPPPRDLLLDLILSFGAAAEPTDADLLGALAGFDGEILSMMRTLRQQGRALVSPALFEQISRAATNLPAPASVRLDEVLSQARAEMISSIDRHRGALLAELQAWAPHMDLIQVTTLLEKIWRTEAAATPTDQLAASEMLLETQRALEELGRAQAGRLRTLLDSASGASAPPEIVAHARAAIEKGDPRDLSSALMAMRGLGSREAGLRAEREWREARGSLETTCARARQAESAGGAAGAGAPQSLLAEALREAERTLRTGGTVSTPAEMQAHAAMLASWDRAIGALLDGRPGGAADEAQRSRQTLAEALQKDIARHVALDLGIQDQSAKLPSGDIDGTARKLLESAISGGGSFQQAYDNALALARKVRGRSDTRLRDSSGRLRAAAAEMAEFLDKAADQLPTARVVQARLWLDQVEGIIASCEIPSMDSMTRTLADDFRELGSLMELVRRRRQSREAGERESLKTEAARFLKAATVKGSGRIQAIAQQIERADAKALGSLRDQLDKAGAEVEQTVRLSAGRALYAAGRLLPRGGKQTAPVPEKLRKLDELAGALGAAMEKDDLARLVSLTKETRAEIADVSPMSRPPIRIAMAGAAILVVAGGLVMWSLLSGRPETFRLKLAGSDQQTVSVRLARAGEFVEGPVQAKGNATVEFQLAPGRYEVFVNDKYTGRVIRVPGPADVGEVPIP